MKIAVFLTLVLSLGMPARAQESAPPEWFKKLDRNGDGKITREELPRIFDAVDTNKDGVASLEELRDYFTKNPPQRNGAAMAQAEAGQPRTPEPAAQPEVPQEVEKRAVTIWSDGTKMAGDLYLPKNRISGEKLPAIVFCSGTGGTKKGSPAQLGPAFAAAGYAFLGFDYRGWGESGSQIFVTGAEGSPDGNGEVSVKGKLIRWQMNLADQTFDIRCAIAFLAGEPGVDASRIGLLGSSYGGGLVTWMAANDSRVKCAAAQVPGMGGGRTEAANTQAFELLTRQARGETEPIPFETGKLGGKLARYDQMRVNPSKNIGFNIITAAENIRVPLLIIDAEKEELMDIRENGQKVADILKKHGTTVEYQVLPGMTHYGVYREGLEQATKLEVDFFNRYLKEQSVAAASSFKPPESISNTGPGAPVKPARPPEEVFAYLDTNGDGKVSLSEFESLDAAIPYFKEHPEVMPGIFKRFDSDGDGFLSLDELRVFLIRRPATSSQAAPKPAAVPEAPPTAEGIAFFEKHIRPVLADKCYECHSAEAKQLKGGLRLDTRTGISEGGEGGPAIVPGNAEKSPLIEAIRYTQKDTQMPPQKHGGKLPDPVIARFEEWVKMGAPDPRVAVGGKLASSAQSAAELAKGREHWAFQPMRKTEAPKVQNGSWPRSEVDRYLLHDMEAKALQPVADATPETLLRRVSFDLTGLPPSRAEVEAFGRDASPEAFAKVVDRLLQSPQFGERWGRHWLDVARYADSTGRGTNLLYPQAWRYRDYVIASFNADKPYDLFIREQIAGDLLPAENDDRRVEQLVATGFLAVGPKQLNERDRLQFQLDLVDEQLDTLGQSILGLTVGCARCHDHKFDPIPQRDYYALAGIFRSTETLYGTVPVITNTQASSLLELPASAVRVESGVPAERLRAEQARMEKELLELTGRGGLEPFQLPADPEKARRSIGVRSRLAVLNQQIKNLGEDGKSRPLAMGARDKVAPADMPLYLRGEPSKPSDTVPRGFLQVIDVPGQPIAQGSGRVELANWLVSPENPLTARVMTNRVWQHLFGRGMVPSVDNFGTTGEKPGNIALLDHLATHFVENGWSVKKLISEIVLSRAYQLSATYDPTNDQIDPDNTLIWRMAPRRLDAEATRDAMLAVSGKLQQIPPQGSLPARIGDSFAGLAATRAALEAESGVRSVYLTVLRDQLNDALSLFDFSNPNAVNGRRDETTTPAQALYLMNSPVMLSLSEAWATRLSALSGGESEQVKAAYFQAFGRAPTQREERASRTFFEQFSAGVGGGNSKESTPQKSLSSFCQALFASAEFRTLY